MNAPTFTYSKWRHGGWYVHEVRYPSGAIGCVYKGTDGRWRIACDPRPGGRDYTYRTRDDAARAEQLLADSLRRGDPWFPPTPHELRYLCSTPVLPELVAP